MTPETRAAADVAGVLVRLRNWLDSGYDEPYHIDQFRADLHALLSAVGDHVSTSQAAALIGVSRVTLVRYLDQGRLSFTQPGKHRRIRLADLLEFKKTITHDRHQPLTDEPSGVIPTQRGRQLVNAYRTHRTQQNPKQATDA